MEFQFLMNQSWALKCLVTYFYTPLSCSLMAIGALEPAITILQKNGYNSETFHKQATKKHRGMPHALIMVKIPTHTSMVATDIVGKNISFIALSDR